MPTYLDMLPDEIYHMIYRPIFADVIKERVRRRVLDLKHRTLNHYHTLDAYDLLFKRCRINRSIVYAWLLGIKKEEKASEEGEGEGLEGVDHTGRTRGGVRRSCACSRQPARATRTQERENA